MSQKVKTLLRIAEILDNQKGEMEQRVLQIRNRFTQEKKRLTALEGELKANIRDFDQRLETPSALSSRDVDHFFALYSFLADRAEKKQEEVLRIEGELEAGQAVLLKAYQKQKALDIFKNKTVWQERKEEELWEQKSLDYLNLITRWGKY